MLRAIPQCCVSASLLAACSVLLRTANASPICTSAPTVTCTGPDDYNTTTLSPFGASFITQGSFLNAAVANSSFKLTDNWSFTYAANPIPMSDLTVDTYTAWAVTDDPITDPDGVARARPVAGADAGGANFILSYTPRPNSTDPPTIDFLQMYQQSINGGANQAFIDNAGKSSTPFYIQAGGVGNAFNRWMLDVPYDCENSGTPLANGTNIGPSPTCSGGTDEAVLSANVNFQTLVAVDNGFQNGIHNVLLYGGESWGYTYTNTDIPEPALGPLSGAFLLGLIVLQRRRS
ncbi:MAG TPA: hypothetical protein VKV15_13075 [Bryobacteraceae bacterium]|nr:hypothetical protein [Bryobacteraceae bacterium]